MMLNEALKDLLKSNWGEKADTLNCYAEVKLIDPLSSWACYIFAIDDTEQVAHCLIYSDCFGVEIYTQPLHDICTMYNEEGNNPIIDREYRRTRVTELLKRLRNDAGRD